MDEENTEMFENIDEASGFWKELWEMEGTGDKSVTWLDGIKKAISRRVPFPSEGELGLDVFDAVKNAREKRNWSAQGSDRLDTY